MILDSQTVKSFEVIEVQEGEGYQWDQDMEIVRRLEAPGNVERTEWSLDTRITGQIEDMEEIPVKEEEGEVSGWGLTTETPAMKRERVHEFTRAAVAQTLKRYGTPFIKTGRKPSAIVRGAAGDVIRFDGMNHWSSDVLESRGVCQQCKKCTKYKCNKCNKYLHPTCFHAYHTGE